MKVVLVFALLVAVVTAVPQRPPTGMRFDPRFARRPPGPEGSGFGPMRRFRPGLGFQRKPWSRDFRPQHRPGPKMPVHGKPGPHQFVPKRVHLPSKHNAGPHQSHKGPKGVAQKPLPHHKAPLKPNMLKRSPVPSKHPKVFKPPAFLHKKPTIRGQMKSAHKKLVMQHKWPSTGPGAPPFGAAKMVYVYVPYCPDKQLYGPRQLFSPLLPFNAGIFQPRPAYGPNPFYQDAYQPGYQEIDLEEPNYAPEYDTDFYGPGLEYAPQYDFHKEAPTHYQTTYHPQPYNHNEVYGQKFNTARNYNTNTKLKSAKLSTPLKHDINYVEPVGFSKTEKHYATKPLNYKPQPKYNHKPKYNPSKTWNYIPDIKDFEPGKKFEDVKFPFQNK